MLLLPVLLLQVLLALLLLGLLLLALLLLALPLPVLRVLRVLRLQTKLFCQLICWIWKMIFSCT